MVTGTSTGADVESVASHWSDLELCEALYWLRRARQRDDPAMIRIWTDRLNALLDWRLEHGPDTLA
jgi:hypothetical protein